jgi:putative oxidoreductase
MENFLRPWPASQFTGVSPLTMIGAAGVLELVGGALLTIGLFTRPVAFILSGMCAVAYFLFHFPRSFFPFLNGGETVILFTFALLYIAAAGGGAWSVDRMWRNTKD